MTIDFWFRRAIKFTMGICDIHKRPVFIESRGFELGPWAVYMDGWVLGKDKEWHWEPLPSSRTEEFIMNTRFNDLNEAYDFWTACKEETKNKPLTL